MSTSYKDIMTYEEREAMYQAFKQQLEEAGWKIYTDNHMRDAELNFYVCRKPQGAYDCCLNDKAPLFMAKLWHFYCGLYNNYNIPDSRSAEVHLEGELPNGKWIMLKTSCEWEVLLDEAQLKKIEHMLVKGYNAMYENVKGEQSA